jgi:hypothetical protein
MLCYCDEATWRRFKAIIGIRWMDKSPTGIESAWISFLLHARPLPQNKTKQQPNSISTLFLFSTCPYSLACLRKSKTPRANLSALLRSTYLPACLSIRYGPSRSQSLLTGNGPRRTRSRCTGSLLPSRMMRCKGQSHCSSSNSRARTHVR